MHLIATTGILGILSLTGCVTMPGNQLTDVTPRAGTLTPAVEQSVGAFSFDLDGGKLVTSNKMGRILNDEILDRWKESGFISDHKYVKSLQFTEDAKYRISLSGHQDGESNILLQIISGLTLTAIPYYVDTRMNLRYSVENSESGCVFEANATDSFNTVVGLFLLPAAPFMQGGRSQTYDRIANNLYEQLASQGAFEPHANCVANIPTEPMENRLRRLEKLRTEGLISEPDYDRKKKEIIGEL